MIPFIIVPSTASFARKEPVAKDGVLSLIDFVPTPVPFASRF